MPNHRIHILRMLHEYGRTPELPIGHNCSDESVLIYYFHHSTHFPISKPSCPEHMWPKAYRSQSRQHSCTHFHIPPIDGHIPILRWLCSHRAPAVQSECPECLSQKGTREGCSQTPIVVPKEAVARAVPDGDQDSEWTILE
jgi:hypothetical protein